MQRTLDYNAHFDPAESTHVFKLAVSDHLLLVLCPQSSTRLNELAPRVVRICIRSHPRSALISRRARIDLSIQLRSRAGATREQLFAPPLGTKPHEHVVTRSFARLPSTRPVAVIPLGEWASRQAGIQVHELPIPTPRLLFEMSWNAAFSSDLAPLLDLEHLGFECGPPGLGLACRSAD